MIIPGTARGDIRELRLDESDVEECVLSLTQDDFHKSDPSRDKPGTMLDVYRPMLGKRRMYVKLTLARSIAGQSVVVVSFRLK